MSTEVEASIGDPHVSLITKALFGQPLCMFSMSCSGSVQHESPLWLEQMRSTRAFLLTEIIDKKLRRQKLRSLCDLPWASS